MECPVCDDVELRMTERSGVEIDYCPRCRGVWLDRGELDKIIERAAQLDRPAAPAAEPVDSWADEGLIDPDEQWDDDFGSERRVLGIPVKRKRGYADPRPDDRRYDERRARDRDDDDDRRRHPKQRKRRKRESFLEDLFDFDLFD